MSIRSCVKHAKVRKIKIENVDTCDGILDVGDLQDQAHQRYDLSNVIRI